MAYGLRRPVHARYRHLQGGVYDQLNEASFKFVAKLAIIPFVVFARRRQGVKTTEGGPEGGQTQ
jgi:hypothetical protein